VATTERLQDIASTSSYSETARLLGVWPLYGRFGTLPFLPNDVKYLTDGLVVAASFAIPVAAAAGAAVSRSRARVLAAILVAIGAPLMVGLFPPDALTPIGHVLDKGFQAIPWLSGFRTTNKAGAMLTLGLTLLIGLGAGAAIRRARGTRWPVRAAGAIVAAALVVGFSYPAWTGNLYSGTMDIPNYWREAASALNGGPLHSRVLFLPGEAQSHYRWGERGVDDLNESLLSRPSALRTTVPAGSRYASNYLAALDVPLEEGALPSGSLAPMARYLGASDILMRNDVVWEDSGGAPPSRVVAQVTDQPDVLLSQSFGAPGQNEDPRDAGASADGERPPPLQRFVWESVELQYFLQRFDRSA